MWQRVERLYSKRGWKRGCVLEEVDGQLVVARCRGLASPSLLSRHRKHRNYHPTRTPLCRLSQMEGSVNRRRPSSQCASNLEREFIRCITVRSKPLQRGLEKDTSVDILGGSWERRSDNKKRKEDEMRRIIRISVPTNPRTPVPARQAHPERQTHGARRESRLRGVMARRVLLFDRDPMWGVPWDSVKTCSTPKSTASSSNTSPNTPTKSPATTPVIFRTPTNTLVVLNSPTTTPKKSHTPTKTRATNSTPKTPPTSPSFKAFIEQEMATLPDTSPLKAVLSIGNFWSPDASRSRAALDDSPGIPKVSLTPTASAISPWKGAGPVPFSPSLFIVQAAMLADGPLRTNIYRQLHCYR
ncbi:ras guanine nucleotide exchange factor R-like [Portunus trituberculatus]|uniref:ras guanine nucleotide exchange factor R-like n=1 Tax=Portunus trituberculatus TaxID=210409 RepID=UPI001E1CB444|nr:ras guanine nucleotide exchange factor R-like [Portunus trituberculatus]